MTTATRTPIYIKPTPSELKQRKLSAQNVERALYALHLDGLVVLEDAVDHSHLDKLNEQMVKDAAYLASLDDASPYNYHKGNIQQDPPPREDLFFRDIFLNDMAIQITSAFLGPRPKMTFLSGNTALKSSKSQPVHSDADFDHPRIPFALVVNVPLISMTPANGSTEIWLGTHTQSGLHVQEGQHGDRASGRIKPEILETRRKQFPPMQPVIQKGSIIIRDLRLWHCGKPNMEGTTRVMLAMIHFASWYRNPMRLEFPRQWEGYGLLEHEGLEVIWDPKDEEIKYLERGFGNAYVFDQEDRLSTAEMTTLRGENRK